MVLAGLYWVSKLTWLSRESAKHQSMAEGVEQGHSSKSKKSQKEENASFDGRAKPVLP